MNIFISHSSKDKLIIESFVNNVLRLGCGINDDNIFCTSIEGLGIKTGEDFRKHIKEKLLKSDIIFIMISENYKESEVCLNEMGAAWSVENKKIFQLVFPNLNFDSLGLLMNIKQAAKLDDSGALDELFEELSLLFETKNKISRWNVHKTQFIKSLSNPKEQKADAIFSTSFFEDFLKEHVNINKLMLKAQPTLNDCELFFSKRYAKYFYNEYSKRFQSILEKHENSYYPQKKYFKIFKVNTSDISTSQFVQGGMKDAEIKGLYNRNVEFYSVKFLENEDSEYGIALRYFCYFNNRWVFFPQPWRQNIENLI